MKLRRFLSLFLLVAVVVGSVIPAYAIDDIHIEAKAALLVEAESGTILYEQDADRELAPASLTKVMTALLVFEAIEKGQLKLDQVVTASPSALVGLPWDSSNADPAIEAGEEMTVENLLYCALVVSANEACNILAETVAGSVGDFVKLMNDRAAELGCTGTHFANPNGLTADGHYTTAMDLWRITQAALKHEMFRYMTSATWKTIPPTNKCDRERILHTTNALLDGWRYGGYQYRYATGIKTGTTDEAGHCLLASATQGSRSLVSVILGAETAPDGRGGTDIQSFTETVRLMEWGFDNFTNKTVLKEEELIDEVPVTLSRETDYVVVHPAYTATAVMPDDLEPESLERVVSFHNETVEAPVMAGDELGTITLRYGDKEYVTVPLLALSDVSASKFLMAKKALLEFFSQTWVKLTIVALLIIGLAGYFFGRAYLRTRRYGRARAQRKRRRYHGRRF